MYVRLPACRTYTCVCPHVRTRAEKYRRYPYNAFCHAQCSRQMERICQHSSSLVDDGYHWFLIALLTRGFFSMCVYVWCGCLIYVSLPRVGGSSVGNSAHLWR